MSLMNSKWLSKDATMFAAGAAGELLLRVAGAGAIEVGAEGLQIAASSVTDEMMAVDYILADGTRAMAGDLNMGSNEIINVAVPTADTSAANKQYVDDRINGIDRKASVRAATTEEITLSGLQTVDGISLSAGDRVLVKNQTDATLNGIYDVVDGAAWTRSEDADGTPVGEVTTGMYVFIEEGTLQNNTGWSLATTGEISLDTTDLLFVQTSHVGEITTDGLGIVKSGTELQLVLGNGFDKSSGTVQLVLDGASLDLTASGLKVAADGITETEIASTAFGSGLAGGSGSVITLAALTEDWNIGGFKITGLASPTVASDAANKQYVDDAIAAANNRKVDLVTLTATDITNGYIDLSVTPDEPQRVVVAIKGAPAQFYGDDFSVITDGTSVRRLSWSGMGLDGVLAEGDKMTVTFDE